MSTSTKTITNYAISDVGTASTYTQASTDKTTSYTTSDLGATTVYSLTAIRSDIVFLQFENFFWNTQSTLWNDINTVWGLS